MKSAIVLSCLAAFCLHDSPAVGDPSDRTARPRVLVLPFAGGGSASMDYLSLGLAEILTDRLEGAYDLDIIVGEIPTLPGEVIDLARDPKAHSERGHAVAKAYGADIAVRGSFSGPVWAWKLDVEILDVGPDAFRLLARTTVEGDQTVEVRGRSGKALRVVSLARIQAMLAEAFGNALTRSGLSVAPEAISSLEKPICADSFAFILHTRAVGRTRTLPWIGKGETALKRAEHAVRVSPTCLPARRLYALLLDEAGKSAKSRGQLEALLKDSPDDIRSIVALGRIELSLGEIESAKLRLRQAVNRRPDDPALHALLGDALRLGGERKEAIAEYEKAVVLGGDDADFRVTLSALYGSEGRHEDAAASLRIVMRLRPDDKASAFRLGAELRNAGHQDAAEAWYRTASTVFDDPRFTRFAVRGDSVPVHELVEETDVRMRKAESIRKEAQAAANDLVMEFGMKGKDACAASARGVAEERRTSHAAAVESFLESAASLADRKRQGDWAALGYREEVLAETSLGAVETFRKDRAGLTVQWERSVLPLLVKADCAETDAPADMDAVALRNTARIVAPAPYRSRPSSNPIAPEIPDGAVRVVRFRIVNGNDTHPLVLTVDGSVMGQIPAGSERTFVQKSAHHVLCLLPEGRECGAPQTLRYVYLHEGWSIAVRSAP